jgi:hypothetical protein
MQADLEDFFSACFADAPDGEVAIECDGASLLSRDIDMILIFTAGKQATCAVDMVTYEGGEPCLLAGLGAIVQPGDNFHQHLQPSVILTHPDGRKCAIYVLEEALDVRGGTTCDRLDAIAQVLGDEASTASDPVPVPGTGGWEVETIGDARFTVEGLEQAFSAPVAEPKRFNDAIIHGTIDPGLLDRDVEIGLSRKGQATKPGTWKNWGAKFGELVNLLSIHKQGEKDGECLLQGSVIDGERRANAIRHLDILMLDLDTGESLEDVLAKIERLGLLAVVWTTHSHMKPVSEVKKDEVLKWLGNDKMVITEKEVCGYFLDRKRYRPHILAGAKLLPTEHTKDGVMLRLQHEPMPKFRVLFLLKDRFVIADRHNSPKASVQEWKERYAGASKMLEAFFDRSCVDPSRLMFTPRHPKGGQFEIHILGGQPLDIEMCDRVTAEELRTPVSLSPWEKAAQAMGAGRGDYKTTSMSWFFGKYGNRFEIDDFLLEMDPDGNRGPRPSGPGRTHKCPNDDAHTDAGNEEDKGFFCVNASESELDTGGCVARCSHDSCSTLDRINFVDLICVREGIEDATELKKWVALTDEDEEEGDAAGEDKPAEEEPVPVLEPFKSSGAAKLAISKITKNDDDAAIDIARRVGVSGDLTAGQVDALKTLLAKHSGLSKRAIDVEIKKGRADHAPKAERAKAPMDDDVMGQLAALNREFAAIIIGPKFKIVKKPLVAGEIPAIWDVETFHHMRNQKIAIPDRDGNMKMMPVSKMWIDWEERNSFEGGVVFEPSGGGKDNAYNLWNGYAVQRARGDWSLLRGHILDNICQGNEEYFSWLMTWMAQMVQQPGLKLGSSVVIRGKRGTGKSKMFEWLAKALAPYAITVSQRNHITGNFNAHQSGIILMVCEEAFWAGDPQASGVLKNLITSDEMMMEKKGLDAVKVSNYARLAMVSNEKWVVPVGLEDERRFFVLECGDGRRKDIAFFRAVDEQMKDGGLEAMAWELGTWKPEGNNWAILRDPPVTQELVNQGLHSMDPADQFFINLVDACGCSDPLLPELEPIYLRDAPRNDVDFAVLRTYFARFMSSSNRGRAHMHDAKLLRELANKYLKAHPIFYRPRGAEENRPRYLVCPSIVDLRAALTDRAISMEEYSENTHDFD